MFFSRQLRGWAFHRRDWNQTCFSFFLRFSTFLLMTFPQLSTQLRVIIRLLFVPARPRYCSFLINSCFGRVSTCVYSRSVRRQAAPSRRGFSRGHVCRGDREREEIERELQLPTQEFGRSDAALCKHGPPSGAGR